MKSSVWRASTVAVMSTRLRPLGRRLHPPNIARSCVSLCGWPRQRRSVAHARRRVDVRCSVSSDLPFVGTYGVDALGALGDPTRRAIFELLTIRPVAVGDLARQLPISRPAVSQHLKVLK